VLDRAVGRGDGRDQEVADERAADALASSLGGEP
jgi:hypothetical protein